MSGRPTSNPHFPAGYCVAAHRVPPPLSLCSSVRSPASRFAFPHPCACPPLTVWLRGTRTLDLVSFTTSTHPFSPCERAKQQQTHNATRVGRPHARPKHGTHAPLACALAPVHHGQVKQGLENGRGRPRLGRTRAVARRTTRVGQFRKAHPRRLGQQQTMGEEERIGILCRRVRTTGTRGCQVGAAGVSECDYARRQEPPASRHTCSVTSSGASAGDVADASLPNRRRARR